MPPEVGILKRNEGGDNYSSSVCGFKEYDLGSWGVGWSRGCAGNRECRVGEQQFTNGRETTEVELGAHRVRLYPIERQAQGRAPTELRVMELGLASTGQLPVGGAWVRRVSGPAGLVRVYAPTIPTAARLHTAAQRGRLAQRAWLRTHRSHWPRGAIPAPPPVAGG